MWEVTYLTKCNTKLIKITSQIPEKICICDKQTWSQRANVEDICSVKISAVVALLSFLRHRSLTTPTVGKKHGWFIDSHKEKRSYSRNYFHTFEYNGSALHSTLHSVAFLMTFQNTMVYITTLALKKRRFSPHGVFMHSVWLLK